MINQSNTHDLFFGPNTVKDFPSTMHRNREPLIHTAVYIELIAHEHDKLKELQTEVLTELIRSKLNVDKLMLKQQQGFISVILVLFVQRKVQYCTEYPEMEKRN